MGGSARARWTFVGGGRLRRRSGRDAAGLGQPRLIGGIGALEPANHPGGHWDHRVLDDDLVEETQDRVLRPLLDGGDADGGGGDGAEDDGVDQFSEPAGGEQDRKSTRLNSSHVAISYAVFCLKKKRR